MDEIKKLCEDIVSLISPEKIILFSTKRDVKNEVQSFKICVIAEGNPAELEGKIYLGTDCSLLFDVLVYSMSDWVRFSSKPDSFAYRILKGGSILYEQAG